MRIEFDLRALKAAVLAVQSDETRYYLNGVCIDYNGESFVCVATSGKALAAFKPDCTIENGPLAPFEVIIPSDFIAGLKLDKRVHFGALVLDGDKWFLDYFGLRQFIPVDGTFPSWRRVLPSELNGETAQYDPALLMPFQKMAKLYGSKQIITIAHNGSEPAIVWFNCDEIDGFGVVMPFRGEAPTLPPYWARVLAVASNQDQAA